MNTEQLSESMSKQAVSLLFSRNYRFIITGAAQGGWHAPVIADPLALPLVDQQPGSAEGKARALIEGMGYEWHVGRQQWASPAPSMLPSAWGKPAPAVQPGRPAADARHEAASDVLARMGWRWDHPGYCWQAPAPSTPAIDWEAMYQSSQKEVNKIRDETQKAVDGFIAQADQNREAFEQCDSERKAAEEAVKSKDSYVEELESKHKTALQDAANARKALQDAQNRIFDLLLDDDAQAHKEAERYLEKANPELKARLDEHENANAQSESSYKKDAERFRKLAAQTWAATTAGLVQDAVRFSAIVDMPQGGYTPALKDVPLSEIADAITTGVNPE